MKVSKDQKKQPAISSPVFTRPGYSSPVLRAKLEESDADFKSRMLKAGWTNLEQVGFHRGPELGMIHAGQQDKCSVCQQYSRKKQIFARMAFNSVPSSEPGDPTPESEAINKTRSSLKDKYAKAAGETNLKAKLPDKLFKKQARLVFDSDGSEEDTIDHATLFGYDAVKDDKGKLLYFLRRGSATYTDKNGVEKVATKIVKQAAKGGKRTELSIVKPDLLEAAVAKAPKVAETAKAEAPKEPGTTTAPAVPTVPTVPPAKAETSEVNPSSSVRPPKRKLKGSE